MTSLSDHRETDAVSPVVGVILMVAITVILSAVVGAFVFDLAPSQEPLRAGVTVDEHTDNTATVQLNSLDSAETVVVSNTEDEWVLSSVGEEVTVPYGRNAELTIYGQADGQRTVLRSHEFDNFKTSLWMESSTCDDVDVDGDGTSESYCGSTVEFNNSEIFSARGVNIMVLDEQGEFVSYAWYDTHSLDRYRAPTYTLDSNGEPDMPSTTSCTDCVNSKVVDHLDSIEDGHYVVLVGDDQPGRNEGTSSSGINDVVEDKYRALGADFGGNATLGYRDNWLLVAQKGDGKILEQWAERGRESGVPYVNDSFYAPYKSR